MVLRPIREHVILECDGSGYMICEFSDPVDRLKGVLGGQNGHNSRDINFDTLKSIFSCIPSRHGLERLILYAWDPCRSKWYRLSHSLCILNKTTSKPTSQYVCGCNYDFDPKIEIFRIGHSEMEIRNVSSRDSYHNLWVTKVLLDFCNYQKLTSETSKFNPYQ